MFSHFFILLIVYIQLQSHHQSSFISIHLLHKFLILDHLLLLLSLLYHCPQILLHSLQIFLFKSNLLGIDILHPSIKIMFSPLWSSMMLPTVNIQFLHFFPMTIFLHLINIFFMLYTPFKSPKPMLRQQKIFYGLKLCRMNYMHYL